MRVSITTLGCKLNQAESEEIKQKLEEIGCFIVPHKDIADTAIIRACAVTENASQTTREFIRSAKKNGSYVIASGCLENRNLVEIDYIAETAGDILKKVKEIYNFTTKSNRSNDGKHLIKTRLFIKIQTGCNFNCAYCVIPHFRGKSKSISAGLIIKKIKEAEKSGYHEVVLTGVNICQYKCGNINITSLLKKILIETNIERIRLGSLDPRLINDDFIELFSNKRLMPHWHLSLQSGSDKILSIMNRNYSSTHYCNLVKKVKKSNQLFSFTTDVIVGFPGETEKYFRQTQSFIQKIGFSRIHVFRYSKRPLTQAVNLPGQIQENIKTHRAAEMLKLSKITSDKYRKLLIGEKREVLFEQKKKGYWLGYTPEYVPIRFKSAKNLKNLIITLKLAKTNFLPE